MLSKALPLPRFFPEHKREVSKLKSSRSCDVDDKDEAVEAVRKWRTKPDDMVWINEQRYSQRRNHTIYTFVVNSHSKKQTDAYLS